MTYCVEEEGGKEKREIRPARTGFVFSGLRARARRPTGHATMWRCLSSPRARGFALSRRGQGAGRVFFLAHCMQALAIETAEACAEYLHRRIREDWGFPDSPAMTMKDRFTSRYRGKAL